MVRPSCSPSALATPTSQARTGTLDLAHGEVQTPAFVPLATKGAVKTLEPRDVEALGYEMVLGNTFHLFLAPGPGADRQLRRAAQLHALAAADHHRLGRLSDLLDGPRLAWPRRSRAATGRPEPAWTRTGAILAIEEAGVRFRSYLDGSERFLGPEESMAVQAALHSDIALVLDECTPFHVTPRLHGALDRAHPPLAGRAA